MVRSIALRGFDQVLLYELHCHQNTSHHSKCGFFVMVLGPNSFLVSAANGRSSDRLHGGIWDQVRMGVCPEESG